MITKERRISGKQTVKLAEKKLQGFREKLVTLLGQGRSVRRMKGMPKKSESSCWEDLLPEEMRKVRRVSKSSLRFRENLFPDA